MSSQKLTLHQLSTSGNSYKIRLTAALSGVKIDKLIEYNTFAGETRTPEFLSTINSNGKVPVLQIGSDRFLPESGAACYYIATGSKLIPTDEFEHADMLRWMFWEQYSHEPYLATLKIWCKVVGEANLSDVQRALLPGHREKAREALRLMDEHLMTREWFVGRRVSLADVVLFAYTQSAEDAGFEWKDFSNVKAWCERVEGLEGYIRLDE